jgi:hypothetical protein
MNDSREAAKPVAPSSLLLKAAVAHTATYFVAGLLAVWLLDYRELFSHSPYTTFMRPMEDPMIKIGPLLQPLRGVLFGLALLPFRGVISAKKHGWALIWLLLFIVGILCPFGAAPGSIEGLLYTRIAFLDQLRGLPEITLQSFLLSWTLFQWVWSPGRKWIGRTLVGLTILMYASMILGLLVTPPAKP